MLPELTKKQLAEASGYTYRRLHDIDTGLPANEKLFVKGEGGKYDLALFVQRWAKYAVSAETTEGSTLDEVRAEHEKVKKRKTELEVEQLEGRLADVGEVKRLWANIASTVTQNLLKLPSKIAPQLRMLDSTEEIGEIIEDGIREALEQIASTPLPGGGGQSAEDDGEDETEA